MVSFCLSLCFLFYNSKQVLTQSWNHSDNLCLNVIISFLSSYWFCINFSIQLSESVSGYLEIQLCNNGHLQQRRTQHRPRNSDFFHAESFPCTMPPNICNCVRRWKRFMGAEFLLSPTYCLIHDHVIAASTSREAHFPFLCWCNMEKVGSWNLEAGEGVLGIRQVWGEIMATAFRCHIQVSHSIQGLLCKDSVSASVGPVPQSSSPASVSGFLCEK